MSLRAVAAISACILIVALSAGCINAQWAKDILSPDEAETTYEMTEKVVQKHYFNTVVNDPNSVVAYVTNTTMVPEGTLFMHVRIDVSLQPLPSQLPIPIPIPTNLQRYVRINITMPDGTAWYERTFNVTGNDTIEIQSPMSGEWIFTASAMGYGSDLISYHDGFKLIATANEPVRA